MGFLEQEENDKGNFFIMHPRMAIWKEIGPRVFAKRVARARALHAPGVSRKSEHHDDGERSPPSYFELGAGLAWGL